MKAAERREWRRRGDEAEKEFFIRLSQAMRDAMGIAQVNQQELARRMKLTPGRVSQILSGKYNLNLNTVVKVFMHLGVGIDFKMRKVRR